MLFRLYAVGGYIYFTCLKPLEKKQIIKRLLEEPFYFCTDYVFTFKR